MTMSNKLKFAAVAILTPTLIACQTMQGIQSDATSLKEEMFTPDTHAQIAEKTGASLAAVKAFDVNCQKVNQEVSANVSGVTLKGRTFELGCDAK